MPRYILCVPIALIVLFVPISSARAQKLTLKNAIDEALAHNPDLSAAEHELKAVRATFWEGISPDYPEFFVEYEGIPEEHHSLNDYEERKIGFAQGIDFPLAFIFRGQKHHYEKKQKEGEYFSVRNGLVFDVKKSFYKIVLLENQFRLYQEIHNITQQFFQKARVRVLAGESSPYDTLKTKVDLAEVENELLALEKALEIARVELATLLGRDEEMAVDVVGDLTFTPLSFEPENLHDLALANHPLITEAEAEANRKNASRYLSWMGLMPSLHLRYFKQDFPNESLSNAWGTEIGATVPLWFFLKGQGSIRSATFQLNAARWNIQSVKRKVLLEVNRTLSELIMAEKHVQNYRRNTLQEVEELVRIATRSYEEGEMGYLEMAEALRTLNRIKAGYFESLYRYLTAQADLARAVGITLNN